MNRVAAISRSPGETRMAVVEDGCLTDLWIERDHDPSLVDRYFMARVVRRERAMGGTFIDIGEGRQAFLRTGQRNATPDEGQSILVQIDQDGAGEKLPRARAGVVVPGATLVFDPAGRKPRVSRRVTRPADRKRLLAFAEGLSGDGAAIVRLGAEAVTEEALAAEYRFLRDRWRAISKQCKTTSGPGEIALGDTASGRFLRDCFAGRLDLIVFDSSALRPGIERARLNFPGLASGALEYHSGSVPLFEHLNIEEQVEAAANSNVVLDGGGVIHFEGTRAATVIDVDGGTAARGAPSAKSFGDVNMRAAREIARQIRLRNIAGIGVVDFVGATVRGLDDRILDSFKSFTRTDPQNVRVMGTTKLGLVEFTRRRQRRALEEDLFEIEAAEPRFSPETVTLAALRRLAQESRWPGAPGAVKLRMPPSAARLLRGERFAPAREALLQEWGVALKVEADAALAADAFEIEPYG